MSPDQSVTTLENCQDEILHLPGTIQPHGILLALELSDLTIRQISDNCEPVFGSDARALIGKSFLDFIEPALKESVHSALAAPSPLYSNPLTIAVINGSQVTLFDGIAHASGDYVILELEDRLRSGASNSVTSRGVELYFSITSETLNDLRRAQTLREAAQKICDRLKGFTGFDRVMFYYFYPDFHGEVIGEAREPSLEPFLGLHYPASDIPKQARDLYVKNQIRLIADVGASPAPVLPATPLLDMSDFVLRPVSPIHIEYLKNMGVTASMSISFVDGDKLWALIACHHYSGAHFVPYSIRVACVHLGMVVSPQLLTMMRQFASEEQAGRRERLAECAQAMAKRDHIFDAIREQASYLSEVMRADGIAFISDEDDTLTYGLAPSEDELLEILRQLRLQHGEEIYSTEEISRDNPDLKVGRFVAGLLSIPLGEEWNVLFFRKEHAEEVSWAGNPNKSNDPTSRLTPRGSFEEWKETILGKSKAWTESDHQIAKELSAALIAFVLQKNVQLKILNEKLENKNLEIQQFVYSVSHDLKSPLVTINGWIKALEEETPANVDDDYRDYLKRIGNSSARMGALIDALLSFSKIGRRAERDSEIDTNDIFNELSRDFEIRLRKAGATLVVEEGLPPVIGDEEEVRRAFQNLFDNAFKYGLTAESPMIKVQVDRRKKSNRFAVIDNGPGIEPRYQKRIFELFQRLSNDHRGTGLGLASVAKVAQLHHGRCGVESTPGNGAAFWIEFPNVKEKGSVQKDEQ